MKLCQACSSVAVSRRGVSFIASVYRDWLMHHLSLSPGGLVFFLVLAFGLGRGGPGDLRVDLPIGDAVEVVPLALRLVGGPLVELVVELIVRNVHPDPP